MVHRIMVTGDQGAPELEGEDPVLALLKEKRDSTLDQTVVFLGDNIYSDGYDRSTEKRERLSKKKLNRTLSALAGFEGEVLFTAGNHDWYAGIKGLRAQKAHVENHPDVPNAEHLPSPGCPGPELISVTDGMVMVFLDSEWLIKGGMDSIARASSCSNIDRKRVISELETIADEHRDKTLLLATHHPFRSNGKHAGHFTWKEHLFPLRELNSALWFPLPFLGSIYPLARRAGVSSQDLNHDRNERYREDVLSALSDHPNVVTLTGHEHNLQYFRADDMHHVVSGAGSKRSPARKGKGAKFVMSQEGFVTLDLYDNGSLWLSYWAAEKPYSQKNPVFRNRVRKEWPGETGSGDQEGP